VVDISVSGVAVQCENIPDDFSVSLKLEGFGAVTVSRLRAAPGSERLLVRESDSRARQFGSFVSRLVEAGKALPVLMRRRPLDDDAPASSDMRQTLNLITQVANSDGGLPGNVALFPGPGHRPVDQPPDLIA
jgi:hypothetical protein